MATVTPEIDDARLRFWLSVERLLKEAEAAKQERDKLLFLLDRADGPKKESRRP